MVAGPKVQYHIGPLDRSKLVRPEPIPGVEILPIRSKADVELVKAYDRKIYKWDRTAFLNVWLNPDNGGKRQTWFARGNFFMLETY